MFASKIVFILGAGASNEVGLPVGSELARIVSKKVDIRFEGGQPLPGGDVHLYELLKSRFRNEAGDHQRAGWMIRDGLPLANSIDDFLDRHASNERVVRYGKLAIVASILEGERNSQIFTSHVRRRDESFIRNIEGTWYSRLMKRLGTGVSVDKVDLLFENVAFVDFNYDRCLPHFLVEAIQPLYGLDEVRARNIVSNVKILHPYGSVGNLPISGKQKGIPFGDPDGNADLLELSNSIRLYTEQIQDHATIEEIRHLVTEAKTIVFLGFGYHNQNLELITPKGPKAAREIFGTAYGISSADCEVLQRALAPLLGDIPPRIDAVSGRPLIYSDYIHLRGDLKSAEMLDEYARTLVASR